MYIYKQLYIYIYILRKCLHIESEKKKLNLKCSKQK